MILSNIVICYNSVKDITLSIPYPSGILIDSVNINDTILRIGRLQYNAISLRPQWAPIYILESLLSSSIGKLLLLQYYHI